MAHHDNELWIYELCHEKTCFSPLQKQKVKISYAVRADQLSSNRAADQRLCISLHR